MEDRGCVGEKGSAMIKQFVTWGVLLQPILAGPKKEKKPDRPAKLPRNKMSFFSFLLNPNVHSALASF